MLRQLTPARTLTHQGQAVRRSHRQGATLCKPLPSDPFLAAVQAETVVATRNEGGLEGPRCIVFHLVVVVELC